MNSSMRFSAAAARAVLGIAALAPVLLFVSGCGRDNFAKVNGQVITKEEYLQALERAPVTVPGAQTPGSMNAGRYVLHQLIGKKVVMAEAAKRGVMPSDAEVNQLYQVQSRLFQQRMPDKTFDEALKEQGTTADQIKEELRAQMAQTNLLARDMNVAENELKQTYETMKSQLGPPDRVQIRIVVTAAGSKEFDRAKKMLAEKVDMAEVARQINPPAFRTNGGLMAQPLPVSGPQVPPQWEPFLSRAKQTAVGGSFGPVDSPFSPGQKVWTKVEKKMPAFTLPYEDAKPLLKQQQVQMKLMSDPKNQRIQQEFLKMTMDANFQANDPKYQAMWQSVRDAAKSAGQGGGANPNPVTAMPAPGG